MLTHRVLPAVALMAMVMFALVAPVAAQNIDDIAIELELRGYYLDDDVAAEFDDFEVLGLGVISGHYVVVLADDPEQGTDAFADELRLALPDDATVLVIGASELGATSDVYEDGVVAAGADAAVAVLRADGSRAEATAAFTAALEGRSVSPAATPNQAEAPVGTGSGSSDGSSGGGSGLAFLVVVVVIAAIGAGLFFWAKSRGKKRDDSDITRARAEIKAQLAAVAAEIVDDEDMVRVSGNEQAIAHYREANRTYTRVAELVDKTDNLLDLAGLNDDIDRARWQLDAAEAIIEGRPVPREPEPDKPAACFFDPTHRPGTEDATIRTSAGEKDVLVCRSCADKLARGERPEPRMIDVGGKRVPAAKAPRSHGGLGMGGIGIFEIILGALALGRGRSRSGDGGLGLDWSGGPRGKRSGGGVFGPDRLPPRPRGLPRTSASRTRSSSPSRSSSSRRSSSSSSSRRRSSSSKGRARGRARRGF